MHKDETVMFLCRSGVRSHFAAILAAYASSDAGQSKLTELGYVPITGDLLTKVQAAVASIS